MFKTDILKWNLPNGDLNGSNKSHADARHEKNISERVKEEQLCTVNGTPSKCLDPKRLDFGYDKFIKIGESKILHFKFTHY